MNDNNSNQKEKIYFQLITSHFKMVNQVNVEIFWCIYIRCFLYIMETFG